MTTNIREQLEQYMEKRWDDCPNQAMITGLQNYLFDKITPGHFLTALLENDLDKTFGFADSTNIELVKEWAFWMHNHFPNNARGSKEKVARWLYGDEAEVYN